MGFRKPSYDVEEKGLDPSVPHKDLGTDGRLLPDRASPAGDQSIAETNLKDLQDKGGSVAETKKKSAPPPQDTGELPAKQISKPIVGKSTPKKVILKPTKPKAKKTNKKNPASTKA